MAAWMACVPVLALDAPRKQPKLPLEQFLTQQMAAPGGKPTEPVQKYITKHCRELLDLALSPAAGEFGRKSFVLLSTAPRKAATALLADDFFFVRATEILAAKDADIVVISRFACLLGRVLTKNRGAVVESVGFLMQLLHYIDDPSVFSLYSSILDVNSKVRDIQGILAKSNFAGFVLAELKSAPQGEKAANLCALVRLCCKHPLTRAPFATEPMVNALVALLDSKETLVLNQVWQAVGAMCCDVTGTKMTKVYDRAMLVLRETEGVHMYHICACDFLGKMLFYAPGTFDKEKMRALLDVCAELMKKHENSTNLLGAVFRILRIAAKNQVLLQIVITEFVPVLLRYAQASERTARAANAMQYLADLEESKDNNKAVSKALEEDREYCEFKAAVLRKYMILRSREYGGPIAKSVQKSKSYDSCLKCVSRAVSKDVALSCLCK